MSGSKLGRARPGTKGGGERSGQPPQLGEAVTHRSGEALGRVCAGRSTVLGDVQEIVDEHPLSVSDARQAADELVGLDPHRREERARSGRRPPAGIWARWLLLTFVGPQMISRRAGAWLDEHVAVAAEARRAKRAMRERGPGRAVLGRVFGQIGRDRFVFAWGLWRARFGARRTFVDDRELHMKRVGEAHHQVEGERIRSLAEAPRERRGRITTPE
jgi:hypothetical protein